MKKRILALVLVVAMIFSFTACSDNKTEVKGEGGERTLVMRLGQSLSSLDWENSTHTYDMYVWHQMFEGLYGMDEANNGYYEELADGITISEDGTVYTVPLREGVTFQNGDPLTAQDVKFSYERAMKNSRFNYLTSPIKEINVINEKTVEFVLKAPNSAIAHTFFSVKISSEKEVTAQGAEYGTKPHKAGTGAYYVTEYDVASGVKLEGYEGYWRGAPAIKKLAFRVIADEAAAVIAYENGDVDYLAEVSLADWDAVSKKEGGQSTMLKGNDITWAGINYLSPTANGALMNDKVRQAICYAIDKDAINKSVYDGLGTPTSEYMPHDYVPTQPSTGFTTYEYNPEKAKELLKEAGFENGVNLGNILTYGGPDSPKGKASVVIQGNLAAVGITVGVDVREYAAAEADMYGQNYDIVIFGDSNNYDFNNIRQQVHSESVGMYLVRYKDEKSPFNWERLEELVDLGVSTPVLEERLEYYTELWSIVMDSATIQPLLHKPVGIVWSGDLEIGKPVPNFYKVRTFSWK